MIDIIKFLFLFLLLSIVSVFVFADTECTNIDCSLDISINVVGGPNGNFSGSVRDLSDGLVANANVAVLGTFYSTITATGEYTINGVPIGVYSLMASADGHLSQTKTNHLIKEGATTTVDFTLSPTGGITGYILDFFISNAINNANVTLILFGEVLNSTLTNADGYYQFINLAPGYYDINLTATGYTSNSKPSNQVLSGKNTTVNLWLW